MSILTLPNRSISESCIKIKINFLFSHYFVATFWGTTKKYENEHLSYFFLIAQYPDGKGSESFLIYTKIFFENMFN